MWKGLTYKKKNQYMLVLSLVFLVLIYLLAIQKTIGLYAANREFRKKIAVAEAAPEKIRFLERKLDDLNVRLNHYMIDSLKTQELILEVVSDFCQQHQIVLKEFPEAEPSIQNDFIVETTEIVAEGSFINLLQLVYELEQRNKLGRITSVNFNSYMDNKRKKEVLAVKIYLQNIKIKGNESDNEIKA